MRTRLDKHRTTEDPNRKGYSTTNSHLAEMQWWSYKSKVKLPVKVAELGQKLYQKAKRQPKFRFYVLYDRIYRSDVQTAATLVLEAIFEADFLDTSFGFRPERSAEQALQTIRGHLDNGYREVYDADLKGYFDTILHDQQMLALKKRIADQAVLNLIEKWLKCEMFESDDEGKTHVTRSKTGSPQSGVISPLLSNVYLHWFEYAFHSKTGPAHRAKARMVRYADDLVILA